MQTSPMLLDIPTHIETERLIIRALQPGDGLALADSINSSLEHLRPWMAWAQEPHTPEAVESYIRNNITQWIKRDNLGMLIVRKSDGQFLGRSGLHHIDWTIPRFEIGYWIRPDAQGKGYITEAVSAIRDFAFGTLKAVRVEVRCDAENIRSAAVAERCGFIQDARLRSVNRNVSGSLNDVLVYSMVRPEWQKRYR